LRLGWVGSPRDRCVRVELDGVTWIILTVFHA
jgi:hypothetical protein